MVRAYNNDYQEVKRDALVFIGRFQIFHKGHEEVIRKALNAAKQVVVVVGSAFAARDFRNPFTFEERVDMIYSVFEGYGNRLLVVPMSDYPYDDNAWVAAIQRAVEEVVPFAKDVGLIGHSKDHTSYYLNIFPAWKDHVEVDNIEGINATDLRKVFFEESYDALSRPAYAAKISAPVRSILRKFQSSKAFEDLMVEYDTVRDYKKSWEAAPYAPTFVTTDAVVIQSGHILLIQRKKAPGKDLWALPGGFLNQKETIIDGMIRELHEETRIKLQPKVLRGSIVAQKVFDAPNRDPRGRVITHAFHIQLENMTDFPKIKAADDAKKAIWIPLKDVKQSTMYADHYHIINYFMKV